jgi:hypothetical protein
MATTRSGTLIQLGCFGPLTLNVCCTCRFVPASLLWPQSNIHGSRLKTRSTGPRFADSNMTCPIPYHQEEI